MAKNVLPQPPVAEEIVKTRPTALPRFRRPAAAATAARQRRRRRRLRRAFAEVDGPLDGVDELLVLDRELQEVDGAGADDVAQRRVGPAAEGEHEAHAGWSSWMTARRARPERVPRLGPGDEHVEGTPSSSTSPTAPMRVQATISGVGPELVGDALELGWPAPRLGRGRGSSGSRTTPLALGPYRVGPTEGGAGLLGEDRVERPTPGVDRPGGLGLPLVVEAHPAEVERRAGRRARRR